ncbi:MAG: sirohydrochlorin cobaltochelatase [Erysipelotrichales bacterium]
MNKTAIIVTYHGSSNENSNAITSDILTKEVQDTFSEYRVIECFSSKVVLSKLEKKRFSFVEALSFLEDNDYNKVYVLTTNLVDGSDYQGILNEARQSNLEVVITKPLLEDGISELGNSLFKDKDSNHLFIGHGFKKKENSEYLLLQKAFYNQGMKNHKIALIDGYPNASDIVSGLEVNKKLYVYPLMFITGFHAKRDVEKQSNELKNTFNEVEYVPISLGMDSKIRKLYINKLENIIR